MIVTCVAAQFVTEDRSVFVEHPTTPKGYLGVKATPCIVLLYHLSMWRRTLSSALQSIDDVGS